MVEMSAVRESGEGVDDRHALRSGDGSVAADAIQVWIGAAVLHPDWDGQGRDAGRSGRHNRRQPAGEGAVHAKRRPFHVLLCAAGTLPPPPLHLQFVA